MITTGLLFSSSQLRIGSKTSKPLEPGKIQIQQDHITRLNRPLLVGKVFYRFHAVLHMSDFDRQTGLAQGGPQHLGVGRIVFHHQNTEHA